MSSWRLEDTSAEHFACAFQTSFDFQPLISKLLKQQTYWKCRWNWWNVIILHATKWVPTATKPIYIPWLPRVIAIFEESGGWQLPVAGFERLEPWFMGFLNRASSSLIFQVYDVQKLKNSQPVIRLVLVDLLGGFNSISVVWQYRPKSNINKTSQNNESQHPVILQNFKWKGATVTWSDLWQYVPQQQEQYIYIYNLYDNLCKARTGSTTTMQPQPMDPMVISRNMAVSLSAEDGLPVQSSMQHSQRHLKGSRCLEAARIDRNGPWIPLMVF